MSEIRIYYQDTDCGGVVYYANYLTYFERARTDWMDVRGVNISSLMNQGILFVVVSSLVEYKSPAVYGDVLLVEPLLEELSRIRMSIKYTVKEKKTDRLIVTGKTVLACVNKKLVPQRIPEEVKKAIQNG